MTSWPRGLPQFVSLSDQRGNTNPGQEPLGGAFTKVPLGSRGVAGKSF